MNVQILKRALLALGISLGILCMGIGIYAFANPMAYNVQFLLQLALLLLPVSVVFNLILWKLKNPMGYKKEKDVFK